MDYLRIDSLFDDQALLVRKAARQFVQERVLPRIRDCYRDGTFPADIIPEMGRLGFLGANLEGYGSEEQKDKWLPRLRSGEAIGCFGLTEPDFGSNPAGMRATARRQGNCWVLNGEKTWITNGSVSDIAIVWARAEDGVRGFLVERGTPGYGTSVIHGKWSMRASVTSSLSLSDCRVPDSS